MEDIFIHALNISIAAGFLVLAIILFRLCAKNAPRWISVLLWGIVGLRLLFPFSIESSVSLIPSKNTVPTTITQDRFPAVDTGFEGIDEVVNPIISGSMQATPEYSANPMQMLITVLSWIWLAVMLLMLIYMLISFLHLRLRMRESVQIDERVYLSDRAKTPFILGVFRPRIYLPSDISEVDRCFVVAHERAHLKRGDHIWKPLGFWLLAVYWFNPLLWVAYLLLCKDIELACDERVITELGTEQKAAYSETLLELGIKNRMISACPLAFGEVSVRSRIKAIAKYKKPAIAIVAVSLMICAMLAVCFLTYRKNDDLAINEGIWYARRVIASNVDNAECDDVPMLAFTEGGYILVQTRDLEKPSYVTLGKMHSSYISKKEYGKLLEGAAFREGYDTEYLYQAVESAWRITPSVGSGFECEEIYLLLSEKELYLGYAQDNRIEKLYEMGFNETLPTYLYLASYSSPDVLGASIVIDTEKKTGQIIFGSDKSYRAVGSYVYENSRLIFTSDDDFALKLTFLDVGNMLIFSEKDSDIKGLSGLFPDSTSFAFSYTIYNGSRASKFFDIDNAGGAELLYVSIGKDGTLHYIVHSMGEALANKTIPFTRYDCISFEERDGSMYLVCEYEDGDLNRYYYRISFDSEELSLIYEDQ